MDKQGNTSDFLLTATRERKAALRFLKKAIGQLGIPSLVNIDQSGANHAGLTQVNREMKKRITIRHCKYLNNIIEQDHRRIKRPIRPMLGFKNFHAAQRTLAGMEVMAMIKKGQTKTPAGERENPGRTVLCPRRVGQGIHQMLFVLVQYWRQNPIWDRSVALGASTPWKRMRWSRGRGTSTARRGYGSRTALL